MRKYKDFKLVTKKARRNYLVSEPNYHVTNIFSNNLLATEVKRTWILMNKLVNLGLPISKISEIAMYVFWND